MTKVRRLLRVLNAQYEAQDFAAAQRTLDEARQAFLADTIATAEALAAFGRLLPTREEPNEKCD
jgi:hypothetical protein